MTSWVGVDDDGVSPGKIYEQPTATKILRHYSNENSKQQTPPESVKPRMKEDKRCQKQKLIE